MFNSYLRPGRGVNKNEKPRNGIQQFFFVAGTNYRKLFFINIINLIGFVPLAIFLLCIKNELNISEGYSYIFDILSFMTVVLIGITPFSAGINYVMLSFAENKPVFISDIFDAIKSNIRQSVIILIINFIAVYVLSVNYKFYFTAGMGSGGSKILFFAVLSIFFILNIYVNHLMINYKLSVYKIYVKAFIFTLLLLPQNILMLALLAVAGGLCFFLNTIPGYAVLAFIFFSFTSLIVNIYSSSMVKKYSAVQ